jgi:hypothetical protein
MKQSISFFFTLLRWACFYNQMLHYAPLPKTMWSISNPVKHWQAPHCSTTPLLF